MCDAGGGESLYRMHSADAVLRVGNAIRPAKEVDPADFANAHREISLRGREFLPEFSFSKVLQLPADPAAAQCVVWFEMAQPRQPRTLIAALGLNTQQNTPSIGWCTLAERVESWSYPDGLRQTLADYPWMKRSDPATPRVSLDAAYFRRHWRPAVKFSTLPDARFSCQMSTVCCKHDFEITLPAEAQLLIDAMPWDRLQPQLSGTRLPVRPDGMLQLKALDESCRFLGPQSQCLIHQTLGRQPFGPCAIFPFSFARTPEGVSVALSPICGSARMGFGIAPHEREEDLRERLAHSAPRATESYRLAPGMEISWERFRDIEKGLRDCLSADDVPLRRRLHIGSRLLGALKNNDPIETSQWLIEPLAHISGELRDAIRAMLVKILGWDRAALRTLPPTVPSDLFNLEVGETAVVVRILQNVSFSKVYSYPYDLTTAHNFVIVLYLLTIVAQSASNGPLSDVMWQELGSLGVHGFLKNVLHEGVPDGFRAVFGTSEFGQWALAA